LIHQQLPPLNAIKAFDAAVREGSISEAARTLFVCQSAISRHIGKLEEFVGCKLLRRHRSGVTLTDEGTEFYAQISHALAEILDATNKLRAGQLGVRVVRVNSLSSFALSWLVPRIQRFQASNPGVALDVSIADERPNFALGHSDCAIVSEPVESSETADDVLFPEELIVVCAPGLIKDSPVERPDQISRHPIIHTSTRSDLWKTWCDINGVAEMYESLAGLAFQDFYISIAAAAAGSGIALVPSYLVRGELEAGTLVQPLPAALASERVYRLILAPRKDQDPAVLALRDWLIAEAISERRIVTYS